MGVSSSQPRGASLPESSACCKSTSTTSVTTMGSTDAHPTHYHTVHGTSHIGHSHHQCTGSAGNATISTAITDGSAGTCASNYCCKQRNRSHSGPAHPIAFPQAMRHSALISAGMTTTCPAAAPSTRRRQSDDSEQTSSSLRSRVSPSGSSFFDSFRYVPISHCPCPPYSAHDQCPMTSRFLVILSVSVSPLSAS